MANWCDSYADELLEGCKDDWECCDDERCVVNAYRNYCEKIDSGYDIPSIIFIVVLILVFILLFIGLYNYYHMKKIDKLYMVQNKNISISISN